MTTKMSEIADIYKQVQLCTYCRSTFLKQIFEKYKYPYNLYLNYIVL